MNKLTIGIQLTKNLNKYNSLLEIIKSRIDTKAKLEFIHIKNNKLLEKAISQLDILATYHISEKIYTSKSEKLKWIHLGVAGIEKSLFKSVLKSKTIITNASGIHSSPVSEFCMGMILYLSKQFSGCEEFKRNSNWTQWELAKKTIQIKGKTIGIIGFGQIGKEIAKKAKSFGMNVIATRRLQKKIENKKNVNKLIPLSEIDVLLINSDFIVIACPLTPLTKGMISKRELGLMKSSAYIINVARGPIIVEEELIKVLKKKQIAGAALDVFELEPLDNGSPLFSIDNVFLSPHISGNFPDYQKDVALQFGDNINRFILGKNLKNRVCKKRLY